jgi:alpha-D-ribose 1-methylphosphonate 5-triphosphate synthase subunit PhnH
MNTVNDHLLLPAWDHPVHDAQATFRSILKALSEPGTVQALSVMVAGPAPLMPATTALCLTLLDFETSVWLQGCAALPAVRSYLGFHCGCVLADAPADAAFAVLPDAEAGFDLTHFPQGQAEYPDRAATLLIQVPSLDSGPRFTISGPGIRGTGTLQVGGLPSHFNAMWRANTGSFPLGVDIVFCCGNAIVGLPRTTHLHLEPGA